MRLYSTNGAMVCFSFALFFALSVFLSFFLSSVSLFSTYIFFLLQLKHSTNAGAGRERKRGMLLGSVFLSLVFGSAIFFSLVHV